MAQNVVTTAGSLLLLDLLFKTSSPEALKLKLYKSNTVPTLTSVAGDFTEADFTGYTAAVLSRATWNSATTVGGVNESTYPAQTFSPTSSQTIYGFIVVGNTSGSLYWAARFDTPRNLTSGNNLVISPVFTAS